MSAALGLVVVSGPCARPVPRERVDWALAAAAMGLPLRLFFINDGLQHLLPGRQPGEVGLADPAGPWRAALDLADDLRCYRAQAPAGMRFDQRLPCTVLAPAELSLAMRECHWLIHV